MRRTIDRWALAMAIAAALAAPACVPTTPAPWISVGACFDGPSGDLRYLGPVDHAGNFEGYSSTDGTCSGTAQLAYASAIVRAADESAAGTKCVALGGTSNSSFQLQPIFPTMPVDAWGCTPVTPSP